MRILTLDSTPMIVFVGALTDYEKLEDWRETKKILISADSKDVIVFRENHAHYIACQESTELVAFGPSYVAASSEGVLEVWNLNNEVVANISTIDCLNDAFFWNHDLVIVGELAMFFVDHATLKITEDDYGDIIGRAYVENGKLIVKMWDDKETKKKPTKKIAAKKKPAKKKI